MLESAGFRVSVPQVAYYVMAEYPDIGIRSDVDFTRYLIEKIGVAVVPASSFSRPGDADALRRVRFCFPKQDETLLEAGRRTQALSAQPGPRSTLAESAQEAAESGGSDEARLHW